MQWLALGTALLFLVIAPTLADYSRTDISFNSFKDGDIHGGSLTALFGPKVSNNQLILTDRVINDAGIVWFNKPQYLVPGFSTDFKFQVNNLDPDHGGMDGFAFVIQNAGLAASGKPGAGIGYADLDPAGYGGIPYSLVVEFDTFKDSIMADPNDNHISIHTQGDKPNNASETTALNITTAIPPIKSKNIESARITYTPGSSGSADGTLNVFWGSSTTPVLTAPFNLNKNGGQYLGLNNNAGRVYVGFTASTGVGYETQALVNWHLTQTLGAPITAANCYATGDGTANAKAGAITTFIVALVDDYGYPAGYSPAGGIQASFGSGSPTISVKDNGDGTYLCSYNATKIGTLSLNVSLNGTAIKGSPFTVNVIPGPAYGPNCVASGTGLNSSVSGEEATFTVSTYDLFGNRISNGTGDVISATITGPKPSFSATVSYAGSGDWSVSYVPQSAGKYSLAVTANGKPIKESPFTFQTVAGPLNASSSTAYGSGLQSGTAGFNTPFYIQARDTFGNPLTTGGAQWDVRVQLNGTTVSGVVTDLQNGTYAVTWNVTLAGSFSMSVALSQGAQIKGSPFTIFVIPAGPEAGNSYAVGDALTKAVAGDNSQFTVIGVDHWGNKLTYGGALFAGSVKSASNGDGSAVTCNDRKDGTYTCSYSLTTATTYILSVWLNDASSPIRGSPFQLTIVPAEPDPQHTTASGDGLIGGEAGDEIPFVITTADKYGNPIHVGGYASQFVLVLSGVTTTDLTLEDNEDGHYSSNYNQTRSGSYSLSIQYKGQDISHSPFHPQINPGPLDYYRTTIVTTLETFAWEPLDVVIQGMDKWGNKRTSGTAPHDFTVSFPGHSVSPVVDNTDGTWTFTIEADSSGIFDLYVSYAGHPIGGNNTVWEVNVLPGRPYAPQCVAYNTDSSTALWGESAGETGTFYLEARDKGGKIVAPPADDITWLVTMRGPEEIDIEVEYLNGATWQCTYTARYAGRYELSINLNYKYALKNGPINQSPYHPLIIAGPTYIPNTVTYGHHLHSGEANEDSVFWISTRDYYQNQVAVGGEYFNVMIKGPDCTFANQTDYLNGTYAFHYRVSEPGHYLVYINNRGYWLPGSPYELHVEDGDHSSSSGLSAGAIAGIVIGCVVGVLLLVIVVVLVVVFMRRRRSQLTYDSVS